MKKLSAIILFCLVSLAGVQGLQAQAYDDDYYTYGKHEVFFQYGAPTFQELSNQIKHQIVTAKDGQKYEPTHFAYTGVFALGYNFYTSPFMSIGGYLGASTAILQMSKEGSTKSVFSSTVLSLTGLVTANWTYFHSGMWELSAQAAAGVCRWMDEQEMEDEHVKDISKDTARWRFAYHLSPLHVRWGGTFGVYADVGWGYKGVANVGLSIRF